MEMEVPSPNAAERVQNKVQCCNEEHVPGEDSPPMEEKSEESEADVINRGDCKKETIKKEKLAPTEGTASDTSQTTTQGASETTVPPTQDKLDDRIDGGESEKKEISAKDNTDCQPGDQFSEGEDGSCENLDSDQAHFQEHTVTAATALPSQPADFSDTIQDESRVTTNKPSELTLQIPNDKANDQGDEPEPELKKNISAPNNSDNKFGDASEERLQEPESPTQQLDDHGNNVENIGATTPEASQTEDPQVTSGSGKYLLAVAIVVAIVAIALHFLQPESPPQTNDVPKIDVFLRQLEKVKTRFPNQRAELWNRGRIHLKRHLQTTQPTEPVSLILTAGLRAEKTLNCLARDLASAYSSALNASVLHIDGASKASQDSDHVKLDIDRKLQGAFDGDKPVAVIHRFEELPPGSTLIFYRYCDHENAAYKKTFLIFTVLLGEEDEIPAKISLCAVEEMVDDHLQKKFLTHGHPVSFDMMDLDKYGGLWSRISHLILPVAAEQRIELEGC
ncbi:torsin-1A-interacting protein 2 isoform X1 [Astatotilapia calliptera]|uniref:Torsin-1A-interacting protein 1/2 AAA+ activator domain-containing protein n=1 Tax=Astatotilapia calliptera TaxID=8154 RepID=A0AAX7SLF1_ASTCA|nr:torsin-1A-interacting protein 2 isoform X1 [Astatotilapia calliptera]